MIHNIAILLTNTGRTELFGKHPDDAVRYPHVFAPFFSAANFSVFRIIDGETPENIDDYDAYFITGSPHGVYENLPWVKVLKTFIVQLHQNKKPLVGICFGHQIIASALGGSVRKSEKGWSVAIKTNVFNEQKKWMKPYKKSLNILYFHQDQITKLPKDAEVFTGDDFCPHAGLTIGKHILTIQGHPEFSKEYAKELAILARDKMPENVYQKALKNFTSDTKHDGKILAQWIANFVNYAKIASNKDCV